MWAFRHSRHRSRYSHSGIGNDVLLVSLPGSTSEFNPDAARPMHRPKHTVQSHMPLERRGRPNSAYRRSVGPVCLTRHRPVEDMGRGAMPRCWRDLPPAVKESLMKIASGRCPPGRAPGFTLVELLVVLVAKRVRGADGLRSARRAWERDTRYNRIRCRTRPRTRPLNLAHPVSLWLTGSHAYCNI